MSENMENKLSLEPCDVITFEGPFVGSVCKKLVIGNPSKTHRIAFKMKTTTPKLFFVRPNIGVLGPGEKVSLDIYMNGFKEEPLQKRHKFLLLAAEAAGDMCDMQEFWKQQSPENTWDTKIRCELVYPKEEPLRQAGGGPKSATEYKESEVTFNDGVTEPMAKLLKKLSKLDDQRLALKEEIGTLRDHSIGSGSGHEVERRASQGRSTFFYVVAFILTILGVFVGAFYGKNFL
ncbi:vesicle-associated membrane protein-associated protein A [Drosophila eugracilis]|uniref:vesicle-associated membrane protein-associated protein A n=1 Tax=Drosophila eugracilis TaxID=29029 RepID=UPI0007E61B7B|nr:vesicle-associated membrane protein-associated protein A [Drosophila eugracilis]